MSVVKEYECAAHGGFDARESTCPHGCSGLGMVDRVFRTAPSIQTAGFRSINRTFSSLAAEHGLSDMSNRGGEGMRKADWQTHRRMSQANEMIGLQGSDVNSYFKPLTDFGKVGSSAGPQNSALTKDPATGQIQVMMNNSVTALNNPKVIVAGKYDGKQAGLPAGDA